jgi:hypothetical protein
MRAIETECPVRRSWAGSLGDGWKGAAIYRCAECAASLAKSACLRKQCDARSRTCGESLRQRAEKKIKSPTESFVWHRLRNLARNRLNQFANHLNHLMMSLNLNLRLPIQSAGKATQACALPGTC